jgi:hypothetical protein
MLGFILFGWVAPCCDTLGRPLTAPVSYELKISPKGKATQIIDVNGTTYAFKVPDKRRCYGAELVTVYEGAKSEPIKLAPLKLVGDKVVKCITLWVIQLKGIIMREFAKPTKAGSIMLPHEKTFKSKPVKIRHTPPKSPVKDMPQQARNIEINRKFKK